MEKHQHLENLTEIRNLMERSSRFLSLSGLSGISAGMFALIGALATYIYLEGDVLIPMNYEYLRPDRYMDFYIFFIIDAGLVLLLALLSAYYFTNRRVKNQGLKMWDKSAKRALINLLLPLGAGGLFCIILLYHGLIGMVAPATLLFYGMALLNAGKYTLEDIRYLGISEIVLGLLAALFWGYGLLFWAIGFGVLHIVYGLVMYRKYEA